MNTPASPDPATRPGGVTIQIEIGSCDPEQFKQEVLRVLESLQAACFASTDRTEEVAATEPTEEDPSDWQFTQADLFSMPNEELDARGAKLCWALARQQVLDADRETAEHQALLQLADEKRSLQKTRSHLEWLALQIHQEVLRRARLSG